LHGWFSATPAPTGNLDPSADPEAESYLGQLALRPGFGEFLYSALSAITGSRVIE
jgi:hypothetical protein